MKNLDMTPSKRAAMREWIVKYAVGHPLAERLVDAFDYIDRLEGLLKGCAEGWRGAVKSSDQG